MPLGSLIDLSYPYVIFFYFFKIKYFSYNIVNYPYVI